MFPGSENVDEARKKAIQDAYATMIAAEKPTYTDWEAKERQIKYILSISGAGTGLVGDVAEEGVKIIDAAAKAGGEAGKDWSVAGTTMDVASLALETAVDLAQYEQWNLEQRKVFIAALDSSAQNLQLLDEIKTAFPDDKILVDYCDDMIRDIEDFTKGNDIIMMVRDIGKNVGGVANITGKNVLEGATDYVVPEAVALYINYAIGGGGAIVTSVGQLGGAFADYACGTGFTIESLEDVDIMYTNVENSIYAYNAAYSNGTLTPSAQRFQELNILNQKMAAVEMSTAINMKWGQKNEELVDGVERMKISLQNDYKTLASDIP